MKQQAPVNRPLWQDTADKAHKNFRAEKVPKRMNISMKDALLASGDAFLFVMDQVADALDVAMDSLSGELRNPYSFLPITVKLI